MKRVEEFHKAFGLPVGTVGVNHQVQHKLRMELVKEEYEELLDAAGFVVEDGKLFQDKAPDPVAILDALGDLEYVIKGWAVTNGWDLGEAGRRIHESNMSKLDENGKPIVREDGKILKGSNFKPPKLDDLV